MAKCHSAGSHHLDNINVRLAPPRTLPVPLCLDHYAPEGVQQEKHITGEMLGFLAQVPAAATCTAPEASFVCFDASKQQHGDIFHE